MKKIDKLVLKSFIGPFILTFLVVVFILLMVQMLKYFDDIIGKGLGWDVLGQLLFYFAVFTTPTAMPLAVLLSALIAYGNLGEHFELTAIKGAGISLVRTLVPIFIFVLFLTAAAFYINNNLVPKAALEAYSLIYDIKQKKPALDLREGTFYNGIPDISIKVDKKFSHDESALRGVVVYDHRSLDGNKDVIKADSGRMYTILNERYLKFELFNGYNYKEGGQDEAKMSGKRKQPSESLTRSYFQKSQIIFDLSSYDFQRTDKKWFQSNRIMRNMRELDEDIDSINRDILHQKLTYYSYRPTYFYYLFKNEDVDLPGEVEKYKIWKDSIEEMRYEAIRLDSTRALAVKPAPLPPEKQQALEKARTTSRSFSRRINRLKNKVKDETPKVVKEVKDSATYKRALAKIDSVFNEPRPTMEVIQAATNMARQVKANISQTNSSVENSQKEQQVFIIQWHKILANSLACIAMFLIGAPLGAIIKKGGLGVPFLVSILFFIIYYLMSMQGEKLARQFTISAMAGVWTADIVLFAIGLIFLKQARVDARLLEADAYRVAIDKIRIWLAKKHILEPETAS